MLCPFGGSRKRNSWKYIKLNIYHHTTLEGLYGKTWLQEKMPLSSVAAPGSFNCARFH